MSKEAKKVYDEVMQEANQMTEKLTAEMERDFNKKPTLRSFIKTLCSKN